MDDRNSGIFFDITAVRTAGRLLEDALRPLRLRTTTLYATDEHDAFEHYALDFEDNAFSPVLEFVRVLRLRADIPVEGTLLPRVIYLHTVARITRVTPNLRVASTR